MSHSFKPTVLGMVFLFVCLSLLPFIWGDATQLQDLSSLTRD